MIEALMNLAYAGDAEIQVIYVEPNDTLFEQAALNIKRLWLHPMHTRLSQGFDETDSAEIE